MNEFILDFGVRLCLGGLFFGYLCATPEELILCQYLFS
jgi:hypothetical protein